MTIYASFTADALWVGLAIVGFASLATGWLARSRLSAKVSRLLVGVGLLLVGVLAVYSIYMTWVVTAPSAAT